jgi:hypothetical protein
MNFVLYWANTSVMKNYVTWLPALIVIAAALSQPIKKAMTQKAVDKNISFAVYKGTAYASPVYNNTSAQLHVTVEKVKGIKHTKVWSKTFDARQVQQYPSLEQAMLKTVTVPKVSQDEHLQITYTITYNSGGSELQMYSLVLVDRNDMGGKVDISI